MVLERLNKKTLLRLVVLYIVALYLITTFYCSKKYLMAAKRLIPDWETDCVFVAPPQDLTYYKNLTAFFDNLLTAIARHDHAYCFVDTSNYNKIANVTYINQPNLDIWVRDFGPIVTNQTLNQFIYQPDYISKSLSKMIRDAGAFKRWNLENINVKLDGGNLIHNGNTAILTNKVYEANQNLSKEEIDQSILNLGADQIIAIPYDKYDRTAHADGMVKWIDEKRLFVGNLDNKSLTNQVKSIISNNLPDVEIIDIPCHLKIKSGANGWDDVNGLYVNFLQTKNAVYVPLFNRSEDQIVMTIMKNIFNKPVEFIQAESLSVYGGVINCVTWNSLQELHTTS